MTLGSQELWYKVEDALEKTIPEYDRVSEAISLWRAKKLRCIAIETAELREGMRVLDAGVGPGSFSKLLVEHQPGIALVGVDASPKLLRSGQKILETKSGLRRLEGAVAVFEALPFREAVFDRVFTGFALRDAFDRKAALAELCRISKKDAVLAVVDIGKPSSSVMRLLVSFYIKYVMPLISRLMIQGKMKGNPWRMIIPTYDRLPTNKTLRNEVASLFEETRLREFLLGGMIVLTAVRAVPD